MKFPNDSVVRKDVLDTLKWWQEEYPEIPHLAEIIEDMEHLPPVQEQPTQTNTLETLDCVSRQAAIDAIFSEPVYKSGMKKRNADAVVPAIYEKIKLLPSVQPTLYGYSIEHLALIAIVMQKKNITPEEATECFKNITDIVQMYIDEQKEIIRRTMEKWTI